jgi:hypothetical protein
LALMDRRPVSLFDVVKRAADIVDPDDDDAVVGDFERAFEDDDEPVAALDVEERVGEVLAELDPAINNGSLAVAGALTVYLSFRRDELHQDPRELIKLAVRAEWQGEPPEPVVEWLDDRNLKA